MWTEESKKNFDLAMKEEHYYMAREYRAVELGDYKEADFAHNMRWKMMDKAVSLLVSDFSAASQSSQAV